MRANGFALDNFRQMARLSVANLWLRYFKLGGTATEAQLGEVLHGDVQFAGVQYDVLAHALNERFVELGLDYPVPYAAV